jgi:hypothetical protein
VNRKTPTRFFTARRQVQCIGGGGGNPLVVGCAYSDCRGGSMYSSGSGANANTGEKGGGGGNATRSVVGSG